jgi:hypothetical protein
VFGLLTVLDVVGVHVNVVSAVILLTLALLAMILLRDRSLLDKATKAASVRMLSGEKIGQQLQLARNRSREWWYKGATGGHLRTVMLPRWVQHAEQENWAEISLHLEILDPTNDAHCRQYAELRNSLPSIAGSRREEWTADRVRLESYATILAACWHRRHSSRRLKLDIALSQVVSTFRWDLSPEYVIQSREDPSASSLVFDRDQPYYQSCRRELESSFHRARTVALTRAQDHRLSDEPSLDEVRRLFVLLELPLPARFTDHDVRAIIRKALVEQNAFG